MNLSRVVGPLVAGALISLVSARRVRAERAARGGGVVLILRWRRERKAERAAGRALHRRDARRHAVRAQSQRLQLVLLRISLFFLQSTALLALLPLVARRLHGGGAGTFTVLLSCVGAGAIVAAM